MVPWGRRSRRGRLVGMALLLAFTARAQVDRGVSLDVALVPVGLSWDDADGGTAMALLGARPVRSGVALAGDTTDGSTAGLSRGDAVAARSVSPGTTRTVLPYFNVNLRYVRSL